MMTITSMRTDKRQWARPGLVELQVGQTLSSPSPAQSETHSQQPQQTPGGPMLS